MGREGEVNERSQKKKRKVGRKVTINVGRRRRKGGTKLGGK